jgi:hypothetical protein
MNHHFHTAAIWIAITLAGNAHAGEVRTNWVTSWYAASQPGWDSTFVLPMNVPAFLEDETVREYVRISAGGDRIKLVFTNRYGKDPLDIGAVSVMTWAVTFAGARHVMIAPGTTVTSDPISLPVTPLALLHVTTYLPRRTAITGFHWGASQRISVAAGNAMQAADFSKAARVEGACFSVPYWSMHYRVAARWWRWATPLPTAMGRRRMRISAGPISLRADWRRMASPWPMPVFPVRVC